MSAFSLSEEQNFEIALRLLRLNGSASCDHLDFVNSIQVDSAQLFVRWRLRSGVSFELAYNITGYLDVILLPTRIRIAATEPEAQQGTSAVYNTQDLVFDGWRGGASFQF